jgi:hypothetical protein
MRRLKPQKEVICLNHYQQPGLLRLVKAQGAGRRRGESSQEGGDPGLLRAPPKKVMVVI